MEFKNTVAAILATVMISVPFAGSAEGRLDMLLKELRGAENEAAATRLENQIIGEWSKTGSPTMDLLLKRGRDALEVDDLEAALEHFRALTDHAPEFAEGWHGMALAFFENKQYGPAMEALERVLALNPTHFGALRGVGAVHEQIGNERLAYEAFERVLDLRPHDADVIKAMERLERNAKGIAL